MDKKAANTIKYILSLVLALVFVWFAFRKVDWTAFWEGVKETRWIHVVFYFLASIGALLFRVERWRCLLRPFDDKPKRMTIWDANNIGNIVNIALPGAGEFVRCGYVSSKKIGYEKALGTIVCERACDIVAILLIFAAALLINWKRFGNFFRERMVDPVAGEANFNFAWILVGIVVLAAVAIWVILRFRDRNKSFRKAADALLGLWVGFVSISKIKNKFAFFLYTVGIWTMYVLMSYFIIRALPFADGMNFLDAMFISSIGNFASVIPVPGGIGAYHYLIAISLQTIYAASWDQGILMATLAHEGHAILIAVLGLISYVGYTARARRRG